MVMVSPLVCDPSDSSEEVAVAPLLPHKDADAAQQWVRPLSVSVVTEE
jgi:hypothetical protein